MMRETSSSSGEEQLSKRILYIDDNPDDQRLVQKVLSAHGYELVTADSGEQGIELATETTPDLILVDIQMPGLDGLETLRWLRNLENCRETPIVALTAFGEKYQRETFLEAGFTDYQIKQAGIKPLLALVKLYVG
jgi:two-component system, cell cycle response regulator DivK